MLRALLLSLVMTACGSIPPEGGDTRDVTRGGDGRNSQSDRSAHHPAASTPSAPVSSEPTPSGPDREVTGAIGGAVAGTVIGGEPVADGLIGSEIGAIR